ncbi:MAG: WD40 repeat domain-containing protein [Pleurocapsa sp. SU_196_0]|nr:WD40 repeat domain-containing protein [Pleurocapsa sp. SU_196_0]
MYALAWNPDGSRLATAGKDRSILVWDVTQGVPFVEHTLIGHADTIRALAWSPDGSRLVSASWDGTARLWAVATEQPLHTLVHTDYVNDVAFSPDGHHLATASSDRTVKIWDASTGMAVRSLEGATDSVFSLSWSTDGLRIAAAGADKEIRVYDANTGTQSQILIGHLGAVRDLTWLPDGNTLIAGDMTGALLVWDTTARRIALEKQTSDFAVFGVTAIDDTRLLVTTAGGEVMQYALQYTREPWHTVVSGTVSSGDTWVSMGLNRSDQEVYGYVLVPNNTGTPLTAEVSVRLTRPDGTVLWTQTPPVTSEIESYAYFLSSTLVQTGSVCVAVTVNNVSYDPVCEP